jgi:hypothetical protein
MILRLQDLLESKKEECAIICLPFCVALILRAVAARRRGLRQAVASAQHGISMPCRPIHIILSLLSLVVVLLPNASLAESLVLKRMARSVPALHGEPQVITDCSANSLRIRPCVPISRSLWHWVNSKAHCFSAAFAVAERRRARARTATLSCEKGIHSERRTRSGGRWSQHRYRRACDGDYILVNSIRFKYQDAVRAARSKNARSNRHYRFFVAFLDCWGTPGLGTAPDGSVVFDANRGLRDWREDPAQHSGHFHLSKPCVACKAGQMAYE